MLASLISNDILPSSVILLNMTEIPFVALDISRKERLTGLVLSMSKTVCDGSHMIAHIRRLNTTELDDTSQTLPKHVANVAFKTTPSSR